MLINEGRASQDPADTNHTTNTHDTLFDAAIEYARHNWEVIPLRGKDPAIRNPHPKGSPERRTCKAECGLPGHGVLDATTDLAQIRQWWERNPRYNIGARVPTSMFVLDVDGPDRRPHPGRGLQALAELEECYGPLPATLTQITGSGGLHLFYRRPPGKLSKARLPKGLELRGHGNYVVMDPSIHPDSREQYVRCDAAVAAPPQWLVKLLLPPKTTHTIARPPRRSSLSGPSIADSYSANTSWADILGPHGWTCPGRDYDADGAVWLHPTHTSNCSATIRYGCLFVYSTNTVFDETDADGNVNGYTRFRAYAALNHNGDMSAAARALKVVA
jgi:hypothetical protein